MELSLTEQFTLIALNDEKGRFVSDTTYLDNGLAGATLLELGLMDRISWKNNIIRVVDTSSTGNTILDQALHAIDASKPESVSHWVGVLNANAGDIKSSTLKSLRKKGIIEKHEEKTLWIFSYNRYPTKNDQPENKIRQALHDIVVGARTPNEKEVMLLGLIDVCQLTSEAFRTKELRSKAKRWYKSNKSNSEVQDAMASSIDALQAAIMAATLTAVVASTTAAT